jgi:hypothetical protein
MWQTFKPKLSRSTADTRRPRFSFFLTNDVKNQTKKTPSPDPTFLSNLVQHSHNKAEETDLMSLNRIVKTRDT